LTGRFPFLHIPLRLFSPPRFDVFRLNDGYFAAQGVKFVVTSRREAATTRESSPVPNHFSASHINRFYKAHAGRAGVAVLGFEVVSPGGLKEIMQKYAKMHPGLLVHPDDDGPKKYSVGNGEYMVGEVYAYYAKDGEKADPGTVIRFFEISGDAPHRFLPGLSPVNAEYPELVYPAYCDHWVSNVYHRKRFLQTLNDVLGFTPKVDFNAGVVAAGEAIIESTVTGNNSQPLTSVEHALKSHDQVYLPINNALSTVGHVHLFLNQMGQGIQHIASRVSDVVNFVALVNQMREITGRGFTFLRIPRSYYGRLDASDLVKAGASKRLAEAVVMAVTKAGIVSKAGIVDLDVSEEKVSSAIASAIKDAGDSKEELQKGFESEREGIVAAVLRARYLNLYKLLRSHLSSETYIKIVRNKVLVDIQGNDILFQIFTGNILQRNASEEAPFLEFIQRVCSERKDDDGKPMAIRPGCGGFGIRNFLTLFLSIEVSKAMSQLEVALEAKDFKAQEIAERRVNILTRQLDESNPVLTQISDAMTAESDASNAAKAATCEKEKKRLLAEAEEWKKKKLDGNRVLQELSDRYKAMMKEVREEEEENKKKE